MAARAVLAAGDVYVERIVGGAGQGLAGPFEANKFAVKPNSTLKEINSKGKNTYGQNLESVALPSSADLNVELVEVVGETLAIAMLGTTSMVNQTSGTWTNQNLTVPKLDVWIPTGKVNITAAGFTVQSDDSTPIVYTVDDDYIINHETGFIKFLSTGDVAQGDVVELNGAYGTSTATEIAGQTVAQVRARFVFDGKNLADDAPIFVEVYEAVVTPDNEFDFLADEFNRLSLTGKMKTPAGKTAPFRVRLG